MKDMSMWLASLNNSARLIDITMPGSHDAGIYPEDAQVTGLSHPDLSNAVCQNGSIYEQCLWGSRFFDVRFKSVSGTVKTYHQFAGQGATGGADAKILADVNNFLSARGSEFVILRISHTKDTTGIMNTIAQSPLKDKLYKGTGNIALETLGNLRGKAICLFDTQDFEVLHPHLGFHPFSKYSGKEVLQGLQTCGKFADDNSIRNVISSQVAYTHQHMSHPRNHLFVLYWTQTGGNIEQNTKKVVNDAKAQRKHHATGGTHHNMDYMLSILQGHDGQYGETWSYKQGKWLKKQTVEVRPTTWADRREQLPNVIMYDFVNEETSDKIVSLNDPNLMGVLIPKRDVA